MGAEGPTEEMENEQWERLEALVGVWCGGRWWAPESEKPGSHPDPTSVSPGHVL